MTFTLAIVKNPALRPGFASAAILLSYAKIARVVLLAVTLHRAGEVAVAIGAAVILCVVLPSDCRNLSVAFRAPLVVLAVGSPSRYPRKREDFEIRVVHEAPTTAPQSARRH